MTFMGDLTEQEFRVQNLPMELLGSTIRSVQLKTVLSSCTIRGAQWLRCCATNRKVAGSIPDGAIGSFHLHNPSDRTMASNGNEYQEDFLGGKCGRCVRLTTLPPPCAVDMKTGKP